MDLTLLKGPSGALLTGGSGDDDLRLNWFGFMTDDFMDTQTGERRLLICGSCGSGSSWSGMVRPPGVAVRDVRMSQADRGDVYVGRVVSWGSEDRALDRVDRGLEGLALDIVVARKPELGYSSPVEKEVLEEVVDLDSLLGPLGAPVAGPELDTVEDVLGHLRSQGLDDLAGDLEYKRQFIEEDPDELPISLESAREFALFAVTEPLAGSPSVMVDSYGHVGLEWIIPDPFASEAGAEVAMTGRGDDYVWGRGDGVLGLWFLTNGLVRVCGTSGPVGQGIERMSVNSIVPPAHVMGEVRLFLSRLESV